MKNTLRCMIAMGLLAGGAVVCRAELVPSTPLDAVIRPRTGSGALAVASSGQGLWRSLGSTMAILAGLFAVSLYLKKRFSGHPVGNARQRRVRILERVPVDGRRSLLLVAIDEQEILIGTGPQELVALARIKDREEYRFAEQPAGAFGVEAAQGVSRESA